MTTPRQLLLDLLRREPRVLVDLLGKRELLPALRRVCLVDLPDPGFDLILHLEAIEPEHNRAYAVELALGAGGRRAGSTVELGRALGCPVHTLALDFGLGSRERPASACELGPRQIPRLRSPTAALASPTLAALAVAAHGPRDPAVSAAVMLAALRRGDGVLLALVLELAPARQHRRLRRLAAEGDPRFALEAWQRSSGAYRLGLDHGRAQGLEVAASALLAILELRGVTVDRRARRRILALACPEVGARWTARALTVDRVEKLFDEPSWGASERWAPRE